jgi:hypothetical protein
MVSNRGKSGLMDFLDTDIQILEEKDAEGVFI